MREDLTFWSGTPWTEVILFNTSQAVTGMIPCQLFKNCLSLLAKHLSTMYIDISISLTLLHFHVFSLVDLGASD